MSIDDKPRVHIDITADDPARSNIFHVTKPFVLFEDGVTPGDGGVYIIDNPSKPLPSVFTQSPQPGQLVYAPLVGAQAPAYAPPPPIQHHPGARSFRQCGDYIVYEDVEEGALLRYIRAGRVNVQVALDDRYQGITFPVSLMDPTNREEWACFKSLEALREFLAAWRLGRDRGFTLVLEAHEP